MMEFNGMPVIVNDFIGSVIYRRKVWKRSGNRMPKVRIRKYGRESAMYEMNLPTLGLPTGNLKTLVVNPEALELLRQGCSL